MSFLQKKTPILILLFTFGLWASLKSQNSDDIPIHKIDVPALIKESQALLQKHYLFEEVSLEMGDLLQKNLQEGKYNGIKNAKTLAQELTKDLRSNFQDRHIGFRLAPKEIKMANKKKSQNQRAEEEIVSELLAIEIYENYRFPEVRRLNGNIGYFKIEQFLPPSYAPDYEKKMAAVLEFVADSDAIILDLRDCPGGYAEGIDLFLSYFFPPKTHIANGFRRTKQGLEENKVYTYEQLSYRKIEDTPMYVLVNGRTASGGEAVAHTLKYSGRAQIIGETTYGAGYSFDEFIVDEHFILMISTATSMHPQAQKNWESVGVQPDIKCKSQKALNTAHLLALDNILKQEKSKPKPKQYEYRLKAINWEIKRLQSLENPLNLEANELKVYEGIYGNRRIYLSEGQLFYQRSNPERPPRLLIPVQKDEFLIDGLDQYRMKFTRDKKGSIEALRMFSTDRLFIDKKG